VSKGLTKESFNTLLNEAWPRGDRPVRLLGIGVRFVDMRHQELVMQLDFFD
jgi:DNA polymerase-4